MRPEDIEELMFVMRVRGGSPLLRKRGGIRLDALEV